MRPRTRDSMAIKKIGELLVEAGLITEHQLKEALGKASESKGLRLGSILVKKGYASEMDIAQTLAFQLNIHFHDLSTATVDPEAVYQINERLAKKHLLIPLFQEGKTLHIAMADPLNLNAIDDVRFSTGLDVQPCVATLSEVTAAINRYYHLTEPIEALIDDFQKNELIEIVHDKEDTDLAEQVKKSAAPPIIKMVDSIIIHAVNNRASDIHIEPQERLVKLRVRVDGIMRETMQLPKWVQGPVTSRIKLMSRMDISERRVSQDGRFKVRLGDKSLDIRVSTLPTQYGESVVLRVLDPRAGALDLKGIGLVKNDIDRLIDMIERPQGAVLITGPTGSGKTSTLYSIISHIKSEEINIITIEDPIEYELKDVNQVSVNEKTGLTFSYTLRSVLRQDPDVILVGEMRDAETAVIALQAAITGHLVFSTLHTNDAVSSIARLKNMGVPLYMAASALNGVVAQRLVRVICAQCRESYAPSGDELRKAGVKLSGAKKLFRGKGCKACNGTGYSGRTGIYEVLAIGDEIRSLILADAPEKEISRAAREGGMSPLHLDGLKKVASGVTSLEELMRVIYLSRADEQRKPSPASVMTQDGVICPHCGVPVTRGPV